MATEVGLPRAGDGAARPRGRSSPNGLDIAAGFLGAVTAIGTAVVLFLGTVVVVFMVARAQHADAATVVARILAHTVAVDALGAALLSGVVLAAFFCGGYVAARIAGLYGRRQAVAVWLWAMAVPIALILGVLAGGTGRQVVAAAHPDASVVGIAVSLAVLGLLGALLGGETGRPARRRSPDPAAVLARCADIDDGRDALPGATVPDPVPAAVVRAS